MGYWGIATGVIGSAELADGSIVAVDLCDGAVTTCKLANGAVTDMKIDAGAVQTVHIADSAIVAAHIGAGQVFGMHISDGQIGGAKLGYPFDFTGKVRTCGTAGFVVRPGCGVGEAGGLRYCCSACVLQVYNGSWQSITETGYLLGTDFHLPESHAYCRDGELWWDTGMYRPAFYCSGSTYCLATYDEISDLCSSLGGAWSCIGDLDSSLCGAWSCIGDLCGSMDSAWSCIGDLGSWVSSNCSRIDCLESGGGGYQLGDAFYLPDYHNWSCDGELWWDSSYDRPEVYCGGNEIGLMTNPLPTSIPWNDDGELYWDSCSYRPAYVCSYSSYLLWALCTPLTVPTCYSSSANGGLRWCSSCSRLEFYCNGSWYYINADGSA